MIKTFEIYPGITLRCFPDNRFKQSRLSIQLVRPMCREENALNALLPAVLLRGTQRYPDLQAITRKLDDLYGAGVGTLVRRVGDYQTTGLTCAFLDDRFSLGGEPVLAPMAELLRELLFCPVLENDGFSRDFTEGEKKNLIAAIEAQRNDKRQYAASRLVYYMCKADSFGVSRLGEAEQVAAITPQMLYTHYKKILRESPVEIFYVGGAEPALVKEKMQALFAGQERNSISMLPQTGFQDAGGGSYEEHLDIAQGKLCMGFVTPVTLRTEQFAAMQVLNTLFGGGMTSKLFMQVRERDALCYDISSAYHGSKGIMTVAAGIDFDKMESVQQQVLDALQQCCRGEITEMELISSKEALLSSLRTTHDSPGAIESYYATAALSGLGLTPASYMEQVEKVTAEQVAQVASAVRLHTVFSLKGVGA